MVGGDTWVEAHKTQEWVGRGCFWLLLPVCCVCVCPAAGWVCVVGSAGVAAFWGGSQSLTGCLDDRSSAVQTPARPLTSSIETCFDIICIFLTPNVFPDLRSTSVVFRWRFFIRSFFFPSRICSSIFPFFGHLNIYYLPPYLPSSWSGVASETGVVCRPYIRVVRYPSVCASLTQKHQNTSDVSYSLTINRTLISPIIAVWKVHRLDRRLVGHHGTVTQGSR